MKKALITSIFIIQSCSLTPSRRIASIEDSASCNSLITSFADEVKVITSQKFKKFESFNNDLNFAREERKLEDKIKTWMEIGERSISVEQMKHHGAFSKVSTAFDLDSPYAIAETFSAVYKKVESSYAIAKRLAKKSIQTNLIAEKLKAEKELNEELITRINELNEYLILDTKAIRTDSYENTVADIESYLDQVNTLYIEEGYKINQNYEEYLVTREFLEKKLSDPEHSEKAKKVLEKLSIEKLLTSCLLCSDDGKLTRPTLNELNHIIKMNKISRIMFLKRQVLSEQILSISSRMPNKAMYYLIDIVLQKIPKLNRSEIRKFLRSKAVDFRDVTKHFPNIDRVLFSTADEKNLIKLIAEINSKNSDNEFLITFARRVDAHEKWNQVYHWLEKNLPEDPNHQYHKLFENMKNSWTEANNRGPMPEWHSPEKSFGIRFVIDTLFLSFVGYNGYEAFTTGVEEVEDMTGIDILKEQQLAENLEQGIIELQKENGTISNDASEKDLANGSAGQELENADQNTNSGSSSSESNDTIEGPKKKKFKEIENNESEQESRSRNLFEM